MRETQQQSQKKPSILGSPRFLVTLAKGLATGLGTGQFPRAPGTAGSVLGLLFVLAISNASLTQCWIGFGILLLIGWWSTQVWSQYCGQSDGQEIVIDEILGILLAALIASHWISRASTGAPLGIQFWPAGMILLVTFRLFDIWKPWPIRSLDRWGKTLPLGWRQAGMVIVDDLLAGIFAGWSTGLLMGIDRWG